MRIKKKIYWYEVLRHCGYSTESLCLILLFGTNIIRLGDGTVKVFHQVGSNTSHPKLLWNAWHDRLLQWFQVNGTSLCNVKKKSNQWTVNPLMIKRTSCKLTWCSSVIRGFPCSPKCSWLIEQFDFKYIMVISNRTTNCVHVQHLFPSNTRKSLLFSSIHFHWENENFIEWNFSN